MKFNRLALQPLLKNGKNAWGLGGHCMNIIGHMRKEVARLTPHADMTARTLAAEKESAAITGFTSAIAAFGAFFIPKAYGTSIAMTGGPQAALYAFLAFYVTCLIITWAVYTRKGALLYDVERGSPKPSVPQTVQ